MTEEDDDLQHLFDVKIASMVGAIFDDPKLEFYAGLFVQFLTAVPPEQRTPDELLPELRKLADGLREASSRVAAAAFHHAIMDAPPELRAKFIERLRDFALNPSRKSLH
jgi:hypothetical protein